MRSPTLMIAQREFIVRIKSRVFLSMFFSFVLLVTGLPWIIHINGTSPNSSAEVPIFNSNHVSILFLIYGITTSTATLLSYGLVEERTSSVIDVILSSTSPSNLLQGKILGISALSILEMSLLSILGLISNSFASKTSEHLSLRFLALVGIFALPCLVIYSYAVSYFSFGIPKIEDLGIIQLPLILTLGISMFAGIYSLAAPESQFSHVARYIPLLSTFVAPGLIYGHNMGLFPAFLSCFAAFFVAGLVAKFSLIGFRFRAIR